MHASGQHFADILAHHAAVIDVVEQLQARTADLLNDVEREIRVDHVHGGEELGIEGFEHQRDAGLLSQRGSAFQHRHGLREVLFLAHALDAETGSDNQRGRTKPDRLGQRIGHGGEHFLVLGGIDDGPARVDAETREGDAGFGQGCGYSCHVLVAPEMEFDLFKPGSGGRADPSGKVVARFGKLPLDTGRQPHVR